MFSRELLTSRNSLRTFIQNRGGLAPIPTGAPSNTTAAMGRLSVILEAAKTLLTHLVQTLGVNLSPETVQNLVDQVLTEVANSVLPFLGPFLGPIVIRLVKQVLTNWIMSLVKPIPVPVGEYLSSDKTFTQLPLLDELQFNVIDLLSGQSGFGQTPSNRVGDAGPSDQQPSA